MFSLRTNWDASSNSLAGAAARRRAAGLPLLDLTESNPTRVGLGAPAARLLEALADQGAAAYEPEPFGLPTAREAVAGYYRERGIRVVPDQVLIAASTSEAYAFLFKLLADPGDEVLVPEPSYPLFGYLAGLESVRTRGYPLRYDGEWHLDRLGLEAALGPRARAVVVVSPNNPTGSFLREDDLRFLEATCRERGLALLCDEVFGDFPLNPAPGHVDSVAGRREVLTFALSGASKVLAAPGLKVGWMVASGPDHALREALQRLEIVADTYLSASTPSQRALAPLLARRKDIQAPLRARLRANHEALSELRRPDANWDLLRAEGGWSAVLRIPRTRSEQEWALLLAEEDGVLVHPGFFFDFHGEGYLSVSLIVEPATFLEGIARLAVRLAAG